MNGMFSPLLWWRDSFLFFNSFFYSFNLFGGIERYNDFFSIKKVKVYTPSSLAYDLARTYPGFNSMKKYEVL